VAFPQAGPAAGANGLNGWQRCWWLAAERGREPEWQLHALCCSMLRGAYHTTGCLQLSETENLSDFFRSESATSSPSTTPRSKK
jgi:hypothetical protein